MEQFDSIVFQVKINGVWIDISADVRTNPSPRISGMGIMGYGPLDRVGGAASLTFSLDNSEGNSAMTRGYYTPGGANSLTGFTVGLPVMVYVVYDGIYRNLFYGKIEPSGLQITAGKYKSRDVAVKASNWMYDANNRSMNLVSYQTDLISDLAVQAVVSNMPTQPQATSYQDGTRTFASVFDVTRSTTKASGEFNKMAMSELGYIYIKGSHSNSYHIGGEILCFENRQWRYAQRSTPTNIPYHSTETLSYILLQTGDKVLLESGDKVVLDDSQAAVFTEADFMDMSIAFGDQMYNKVRVNAYPRDEDSTPAVLWNLEKAIYIAPYGTVEIRGTYRDPNGKSAAISGKDMVEPVSGTDYIAKQNADGSGTTYTSSLTVVASFGTADVEYTLTNTGAAGFYVTTLQARGTGVRVFDSAGLVFESLPSIASYGVSELTIDMPYVDDATDLFFFSNNLDRLILESGDYALMENSDYILHDDSAGVFDLIVDDEPKYYIQSARLLANRNKFNMMAFMTLDAGSFIKLSETMTELTPQYTWCINGYDVEIKPGQIIEWSPVLQNSLTFPKI